MQLGYSKLNVRCEMLTEERTVNSIIKAALLPKLYEFFIIIIFGIKKSKFSAKVK